MRPWVQSLGEEGKNVGGGGRRTEKGSERGEGENTDRLVNFRIPL